MYIFIMFLAVSVSMLMENSHLHKPIYFCEKEKFPKINCGENVQIDILYIILVLLSTAVPKNKSP